MIFYFSWFVATFLLLSLNKKGSNKNVLVVFILFTLVYGCRNIGGVDDIAYMTAFNTVINGGVVYGLEESFLIIAKVCDFLGLNYKALFFIYASTSFVFLYLAYKEVCEDTQDWLFAIIGFFIFAFIPTITVMRQFLAATIVIFAFTLKLRNKKVLSLIFIGVAYIFHNSSVVCFIFYYLFSIKMNNLIKVLIPIVAFIIGYFGLFASILNSLVFLIPQRYMGQLDRYGSSTRSEMGLLTILLFIFYLLQFLFAYINKEDGKDEKNIDFLERGQMMYLSMYFITLSSSWINRLSIYFILFIPFVFKTFIYRFSSKQDSALLSTILYLACTALFLYQIISIEGSAAMSNLIPYNGSFAFFK